MASTSLTPVDLVVSIDGSTLSSDITVISIMYSAGVNMVSEGSISLGFKTQSGLSDIKALLPGADSARDVAEISITLKGYATKYSLHQSDKAIFTGYVVGYGETTQYGDVAIKLNLKGRFYKFQEHPIFTPGLHAASPLTFALTRLTFGDSTQNFRQAVINRAVQADNGFDIFKAFVEEYEKQIAAPGATLKAVNTMAYPATIEAISKQNLLTKELEYLTAVGDVAISPNRAIDRLEKLKQDIVESLISRYSNGPSAKFWDFLQGLLAELGLNIISLGSTVVGLPKIPLLQPVDSNIIAPGDVISSSVEDFPYNVPTRVIVSGIEPTGYNGNNQKQYRIIPMGEYPESSSPIGQEVYTGVKALHVSAPAFLSEITVSKETRGLFGDMKQMDFAKNIKNLSSNISDYFDALDDDRKDIQNIANTYAEYILMTEKFKQRTGQITVRYMPEIIPGLPGKLTDPLGLADTEFQVKAVQHMLDAARSQAITVITLDHIRKEGELDDVGGYFPNPFYSSYSSTEAANTILGLLQ